MSGERKPVLGRVSYTRPSITELEVSYATDAVRNGWGEHCYDYIDKFEKIFSTYVGARYAIATSSCTGAIHMGLSALGISPNDEVILADTNWIASAAPITYLGATPVLVDILPDSWCLDPARVEVAITPRTKAIMAVHLYGNLCDMERLLEIGERYKIPVIEDAAEAIGSRWPDAHAGTLGRFGVFSFHGTKTMTTGEGGMFVTNDEELYRKVKTLENHGRAVGQVKQFWPDEIGFKYKMSNVQAAIGYAQIQRINELVKRKRDIFEYYHSRLSGLPGITMNSEMRPSVSGYWMPTLVFAPETGVTRERLVEAFNRANIDARVFFHALSSLPVFAPRPENQNSLSIPQRAINLPSYHDMSRDDQDRVVAVVQQVMKSAANL